jgi:hypothetical protein
MPCEVGWSPEGEGSMFLQNVGILGLWVISVPCELCEEVHDDMSEMKWYWTANPPFLYISSK